MISIVIPTYNRASTIERAVSSVLNQTYKNIEVIVVDDCSNDNTESVIKSIADIRLKYIRLEKNSGACTARNRGIKEAQGELIAFQDSDDFWRVNKLERQLEVLEKYRADVCFCKMERHNYSEKEHDFYPELQEGIIDYKRLLMESLASTQTILSKKRVFESELFDPIMKRRQDYDWVIRAGQKNIFCFTDEVLVDVYLLEDSLTTFNAKKYYINYEMLLNKYKDICLKYPSFEKKILENIAYCKTLSGIDSSKEYKRIYQLEKNLNNYLRLLFSRIKLLEGLYSLKRKLEKRK